MGRHRLGASLPFKQGLGSIKYFLFPQPHLRRVNSIRLADFIDRLHSTRGFKFYFRFEFRRQCISLLQLTHYASPS